MERSSFRRPTTLGLLSVLLAAACGGATTGSESSSGASNTDPRDRSGSSGSSGSRSSSGTSGTGGTSGNSSNPSDPGMSSGTDGPPPGCGLTTETRTVDETKCEAQIESLVRYGGTCGNGLCSAELVFPCEDDGGAADGGTDDCVSACVIAGFPQQTVCNTFRRPDGKRQISCGGCGVGRPPKGFAPIDTGADDVAAETLARIAQLERASVFAFEALFDDLAHHGAPEELLSAVWRAADDEDRHAEATAREARRLGAHVPEVAPPPARRRSLAELAIENAEEGCVVETFGAALAEMQAREATDARIRCMMQIIAREELAHAALSWDLAAWLDARIDDDARAAVRAARLRSLGAVESSIAESVGVPALGLPDRARARTMLDGMRDALAAGV